MVGTASEREVRIAQILDERAVYKNIQIRKYLAQAFILQDFLILKTGIAPDGLAGFFLYAASQFGKRLDLIKWVTAGKCDIGKLIVLYDVQQFLDGHFLASLEVP